MNATIQKNNEQERLRIQNTWRKIADWAFDLSKCDNELETILNLSVGILGPVLAKDVKQYRLTLTKNITSSLYWIAEREKGLALLAKIEEPN